MYRVSMFVEDVGHRELLSVLVMRVAAELKVPLHVEVRNASRGHGAVIHELRMFCRDVKRGGIRGMDALLVASDANSQGPRARRRALEDEASALGLPVIYAVPDPHIERWMLLDSAAFKTVFGKGCDAPDRRCEKQRYKQLLRQAIRDAGHSAPLGGIEYAEDLVAVMDLERVATLDDSFGAFLRDLKTVLSELAAR